MPLLIKQVNRLLSSSKTLLGLRMVFLPDYTGQKKGPTPVEWINQNLGKSKQDKKQPVARYEDALISAAACDSYHRVLIGFKPGKLKDTSDLNRLLGILNYELTEDYYTHLQIGLPVVITLQSLGFKKLEKSITGKEYEAGAWLQNPLLTAPGVVEEIRKKWKLTEDAGVLYAQLLALPDTTTANLRQWNDWSAARVKKAAVVLTEKDLVLEAKRSRAGRDIFLPGEWIELKSPWLPIEAWKISHLLEQDLEITEPYPFGGPLVLRPFEDLFAAAWQRIKDGDEPRYEEVKRKRKKK